MAANHQWGLGRRIGFRFLAVYLALYYLPAPVSGAIDNRIAQWFGWGIFQEGMGTGSGDTALDYLHVGVLLLFTVIAVGVWSVIDRKRANYLTLHLWLRMILRYALASILFDYGLAKVFPTQFRPPTLARLVEPYGDFSPMGVLWTFMGTSMPYTIFSGFAECAAGALLLFRRTTTLGSLISVAVLLNVVVLNFCYDVPVKLYSSHLLLTGVVLAGPDLGKLFDFFVRHRAIGPAAEAGPPLTARWLRVTALAAQCLFVAMIGTRAFASYSMYRSLEPPSFGGIYDVEVAAGIPAADAWKRISFDSAAFAMVMASEGTPYRVPIKYDETSQSLRIGTRTFQMSRADPNRLILLEQEGESQTELRLTRRAKSGFLVLDRGFHWISDTPFNR